MNNVMSFKKEKPVQGKYINYSYHLTDNIISTKNGDLIAIFKVDGRTHDCASDKEMIAWHNDLNMLFRSFSNDSLEFWTHEHHHESKEYPDGEYDDFFSDFMNSYNKRLHSNSLQLVNDLYLTVVYKLVGDKTQRFLSKFEKPSREEIELLQKEAIENMEEVCDQIIDGMKLYGIKQLGVYYRDDKGNIVVPFDKEESEELLDIDSDDIFDEPVVISSENDYEEKLKHSYAYSSAIEFLYFLANSEWQPMPVCHERISNYMMDNRVVASVWGDVIQIKSIDHDFYTTAIEIRDYDRITEPGQLNLLKEAPFEYVLTQSFSCLSEPVAKKLLENQENALIETKDRGTSQIKEIANALDGLLSKLFIMGRHHATIHVFDKDQAEVQKKARKLKVMFTQCGIVAGGVSLASEAAYYAKLPGNQKYAPRPVPINSWNFLHFSPFHNFLRGKPDNNPWGPALTMFKTVSGGPLYLNFHVTPLDENSYGKRPLGHTFLSGRSGEGKTTVLNFLLSQAMKYKPRLIAYDRDRGMEPFIRSVGGNYQVFQQGHSTGMAPLQQEPTKRNIALVKRLMRICLEITNNGPLDAKDITDLNNGINAVMDENSLIPVHARSVTSLHGYVSHNERLNLLVNEWTNKGEYGWVFDNPEDTIDVSKGDVFGFDIGDFISEEGEEKIPSKTPILMYLLFKVRSSIDGKRRTIVAFDEFHAYLDDSVIEKEVKRGVKTDRKKDCVYIFSTQEPNDALSKPIGSTVMTQTVTKLCLRDPDAIRNDYKFLTDAEFVAMKSIPELSRQFLVKQGQSSALAHFNLSVGKSSSDQDELDKVLSVLSGEPQNAEIVSDLVNKYGNNPKVWLKEYWR